MLSLYTNGAESGSCCTCPVCCAKMYLVQVGRESRVAEEGAVKPPFGSGPKLQLNPILCDSFFGTACEHSQPCPR
jgi:hypothetical protein